MLKIKKYFKVRQNFHYTAGYRDAAQNICSLKCKVPKEFGRVFRIGSDYGYHKRASRRI